MPDIQCAQVVWPSTPSEQQPASSPRDAGNSAMDLKAAHSTFRQGTFLSRDTLYTLLHACLQKKDSSAFRHAHSLLLFCGFASLAPLADPCIRFFSLSGCLLEANLTFCRVLEPSIHTWHALIVAYFKSGTFEAALDLYHLMVYEGIRPNVVVFLSLLKECGSHHAIVAGRIFHYHIVRCDFHADLSIGSALIDMYSKCGSLLEAQKTFDRLVYRDLVIWNTLISGYAQHGDGPSALQIFERMQGGGVKPNAVTFSSVLRACSISKELEKGRSIHALVNMHELETHIIVGSALVDMYAKCGSLGEARDVFGKIRDKNVVSWNALVAGYAQEGMGELACYYFLQMQESGIKPDKITFLALLKARDIQEFNQGQKIHNLVVEDGFDHDVAVGTALVEMYVMFGSLQDAQKVFAELPNGNVVSWGVIITGYVSQGLALPALELYAKMQESCIKPDKVIFLCVLKACSAARAIIQGKLIHDQVVRANLELDGSFGSVLVDMYAKCGGLEEADKVFTGMKFRDLVSWSVMISAYAESGNFSLAKQCIEEMRRHQLRPDRGIYTSMLAACSHACEVNEGLAYFKAMKEQGITPGVEHFNSIIVLLSHAGYLDEAGQLTQTMPVLPETSEWTSLLAACRAHGDLKLANQCFDQVVQSDSSIASGYALMSSLYSESYMGEEAAELQGLRACAGAWKKPGGAWIEVNMKMHGFVVGDKSHPDNVYISGKLNALKGSMQSQGYVPQGDSSVWPSLMEDRLDVSNLEAAHQRYKESSELGVFDFPSHIHHYTQNLETASLVGSIVFSLSLSLSLSPFVWLSMMVILQLYSKEYFRAT